MDIKVIGNDDRSDNTESDSVWELTYPGVMGRDLGSL